MAQRYVFNPLSGQFDIVSEVALGAVGSAPNANAASLSTSQVLTLKPASTSFPGVLTTGTQSIAGAKTFTGAISASNLSGTNSGDVTLAAVGAVPNANAASLSGQALTLQPANASFPGVVTTGTQTFAGAKTFSGAISASNLSGTNTGDVTLSAVGTTGSANGAILTGQALALQQFTATQPGVVPLSGGGTTNYLRADGTWAAAGGTGTVTSVSVTTANGVSGSVATATRQWHDTRLSRCKLLKR